MLKLTHDSLYNLHEIAANILDFVHVVITHPDLVCICGSKELLQELDRVPLLQSSVAQLLSYDTTIQLGDFYLSTLAFQHTLFEEGPVFLLLFSYMNESSHHVMKSLSKFAQSLSLH